MGDGEGKTVWGERESLGVRWGGDSGKERVGEKGVERGVEEIK